MKAIPTIYRGIKYRSRLEAKWAMFFDEVGLSYHYELEAFNLGNESYLPDFFIPELSTWIEIKPIAPTESEWRKAELLLLGNTKNYKKENVAILYGRPWLDQKGPEYRFLNLYPQLGLHEGETEGTDQLITEKNITLEYIGVDEQVFVECKRCHKIQFDSLGMHFPELTVDGYGGIHGCCDRESATSPFSSRLEAAYLKASQHDFSTNKSI